MQQVLDFAVRELTKIVEASFDNLLLEVTKMEREQEVLEEKLERSCTRGGGGRRRGSENDSASPSGSEDAREEPAEVSKEAAPADGEWQSDRWRRLGFGSALMSFLFLPPPPGPDHPPVLSVSQDWVPILDKVFGQKWCSNVWEVKEPGGGGAGRDLSEGGDGHGEPLSAPTVMLEPTPSSPQQDPRWTPLEDMEVFSPDREEEDAQGSNSTPAPPPGPPLAPAGEVDNPTCTPPTTTGEAENSTCCSSAETVCCVCHPLVDVFGETFSNWRRLADFTTKFTILQHSSNLVSKRFKILRQNRCKIVKFAIYNKNSSLSDKSNMKFAILWQNQNSDFTKVSIFVKKFHNFGKQFSFCFSKQKVAVLQNLQI